MKKYLTLNSYCKKVFGEKVYKIALSASTNCPNRDGTVGTGGCIFCSVGGSGDFSNNLDNIEKAIDLIKNKSNSNKYIAYFQSYTGTYGDIKILEEIYSKAISYPGIVGLSIGTRPDCLDDEVMAMLKRLSAKTTLWIELGLQTIHEDTANKINRCYPLVVYDKAIEKLRTLPVHIITHVILGLPGETKKDMIETVKYVGSKTDGIKLQLLHVLKNTKLETSYLNKEFSVLSKEEYLDIVSDCILALPDNVVIHRLTGDGAKKDLIAPLWSGDKKSVLNDLNKVLKQKEIFPV